MRVSKWTLYLLLVIATVLSLLLLEFLLDYMWLGRHWSLSRMWINLVLVSLIEIALWQVVYHLPKWILWTMLFLSYFTILALPQIILTPLFENPAINWPGGQQAVYLLGVGVIAGVFYNASDEINYRCRQPMPPPNDGARETLPEAPQAPGEQAPHVRDELAERRLRRRRSA